MKENFVVHPNYSSHSEAILKVLHAFDANPDFVVNGERNVIKKAPAAGMELNIKRFKRPNILNRIVYGSFRRSKARRSFEYAGKLQQLGIGTPSPVAYLERFSGGLRESFYVSEHLMYDLDFRTLNHNPTYPKRNEILRQMAAFTFKLHENGINFLDHSPGNTLIRKEEEGRYRFYLIDLNRMRFETMDFKKRMHNFRRLWLSKTMIKVMAREYADLYNKGYEEVHSLMTKFSRSFQKKINSKKLRRRRRNSKS